jgi:hypothetical protein
MNIWDLTGRGGNGGVCAWPPRSGWKTTRHDPGVFLFFCVLADCHDFGRGVETTRNHPQSLAITRGNLFFYGSTLVSLRTTTMGPPSLGSYGVALCKEEPSVSKAEGVAFTGGVFLPCVADAGGLPGLLWGGSCSMMCRD